MSDGTIGIGSLAPAQKVMTAKDAARLMQFIESADFLLQGNQAEEFVVLKLKLRLMGVGAIKYIAQEFTPAAVPPVETGADPAEPENASDSESGAEE